MTDYPGPLKSSLFPNSRLLRVLRSPNNGNQRRDGVQQCESNEWGIKTLELKCADKSSKSMSDPDHDAIASDSEDRFHFAPLEETVTITWTLENPQNATTLTIHVYRAGSSTPVLTKVLNAEQARKGKLEGWKGELGRGVACVGDSPYKVRAFAGLSRAADFAERFTYFDVKIAKVELVWGGKARLPRGAPSGVTNTYAVRTRADEGALNDALVQQKKENGTLDPSHDYAVKLPSNRFTSWMYDFNCNDGNRKKTLSMHHREQWGAGPRFPLLGRVYIAKAAGGSVHGGDSAKALRGARVMWDWSSANEIAALGGAGHHTKVKAFLRNSLDYLRNDANGPPGSTNCHVAHGGKRGKDCDVFTPLPGVGRWAQRGTTRTWSLFTEPALSGDDAGCVGAVFSPSRIALDTYVVSIFATHDAAGGGTAPLDTADATSELRRAHASLPNAKSGTFTVLREVRIRYVRKSDAVETANLAAIAAEYRRAGVVLDFGDSTDRSTNMQTLATNYDTWFTAAKTNPDRKGKGAIEAYRQYFENDDQLEAGTDDDTKYGFIADSWEKVTRAIKVDAIREYCLVKSRKINGPKRAYNTWIGNGNLRANDHQYLLPYYRGLSVAKKAKVDTIYNRRLRAARLSNKPSYTSAVEGAAIQLLRLVAESLLLDIGEHGMVIIHVEAPIAYRLTDGSIQVPASHAGGLSPSSSAKWGGLGSVHLVFIPETPTTTPDTKYHVPVTPVMTHEAGHNLYLCHAPGRNVDDPAGTSEFVHDSDDDLCFMSYSPQFDHLCGYCNLKLRGWGTLKKHGTATDTGPLEDGTIGLSNISLRNKKT